MRTDVHSPEIRSYNMSRIRGKNTKPEIYLRSMLHREGFRFRLHDRQLPGNPDIVLPRYKSVVFVNGCFWHRHEGCQYSYMPKTRQEFWSKKFADTVLRDQAKQKQLQEAGWNVIVVWECELKHDPESLIKKISNKIRNEAV